MLRSCFSLLQLSFLQSSEKINTHLLLFTFTFECKDNSSMKIFNMIPK